MNRQQADTSISGSEKPQGHTNDARSTDGVACMAVKRLGEGKLFS